MGSTALALVQKACYRSNIPAPSALVGATDTSTLQLLNLFYETGEDLRSTRLWPQLKRKCTVRLDAGRSFYQLPEDFYAAVPDTNWDRNLGQPMRGPVMDGAFNWLQYGYAPNENSRSFRIWGPDINPNDGQGQFQVHPTPGAASQNLEISFEYISRSWLFPPSWAASTALSASVYRNSAGNYYQNSTGAATTGTVPPTMANGVGIDGGVRWLALTTSAWASTTVYGPGDYRTTGGRLYMCTVGGTSSSSAPTSTTEGTDITDGTVTWRYYAAPAWTAQTEYDFGDHILISSQYYRSVTPGNTGNASAISGKVSPTWTTTTQSDGTITWTYKTAAYEALIADTDICLFDDESMIVGLRYRFMRARGMEFKALEKDYENMKRAGYGRQNQGKGFSVIGGRGRSLAPVISEGSFDQ